MERSRSHLLHEHRILLFEQPDVLPPSLDTRHANMLDLGDLLLDNRLTPPLDRPKLLDNRLPPPLDRPKLLDTRQPLLLDIPKLLDSPRLPPLDRPKRLDNRLPPPLDRPKLRDTRQPLLLDNPKLLDSPRLPPLDRPKRLDNRRPPPLDNARQPVFLQNPPTITQPYSEKKHHQHGDVTTKDLYLGVIGETLPHPMVYRGFRSPLHTQLTLPPPLSQTHSKLLPHPKVYRGYRSLPHTKLPLRPYQLTRSKLPLPSHRNGPRPRPRLFSGPESAPAV